MVGVRAGGIATAVSPLFSTIILSDSAQPIINEPHDASFICQMFICSAPRFAFVVRCSALVATGEAPFLKDRLLAYPQPQNCLRWTAQYPRAQYLEIDRYGRFAQIMWKIPQPRLCRRVCNAARAVVLLQSACRPNGMVTTVACINTLALGR
jgi:hypothetical protein